MAISSALQKDRWDRLETYIEQNILEVGPGLQVSAISGRVTNAQANCAKKCILVVRLQMGDMLSYVLTEINGRGIMAITGNIHLCIIIIGCIVGIMLINLSIIGSGRKTDT